VVLETWNNILKELEYKMNKQSFNTWLKDTQLLSIEKDICKIKVADETAKQHIEKNYLKIIENIIKEKTGNEYKCLLFSSKNFEIENINNKETINEDLSYKNRTEIKLNPNYSFDTFIIGSKNELAHGAARSVAISPAIKYNPLFIYGNSGLGKTHLLHAIGNKIMEEKPYLKVFFITTGDFITEFINSIKNKTDKSFLIKYRNVDILLIDDIQLISGKVETQVMFFNIFNTLNDNKKQIVITSDRPPREIPNLTDRLKTRFEGGLIADIQPPDLETRDAILRKKAEKLDINISDETYNFIAKRIKSSIRALEAAINKLNTVSEIFNLKEITIDIAKQHLNDLFDKNINKKITISEIIDKTAKKFNLTKEDLQSKSRQSKLTRPRFVAIYLCRKLTELTTSEIGKNFGNRDHSTVINAINRIEKDLKEDIELKEYIDDLIKDIKS